MKRGFEVGEEIVPDRVLSVERAAEIGAGGMWRFFEPVMKPMGPRIGPEGWLTFQDVLDGVLDQLRALRKGNEDSTSVPRDSVETVCLRKAG